MKHWVIRRLLTSALLLVGITAMIFGVLQGMPGGPMAMYEGTPGITQDDLTSIRQQLGLDDPVPVQYVRWLRQSLTGDWGVSFVQHRPVLEIVVERTGNTLLLMGLTLLVAMVVAIPIGVLSASRPYSVFDHVATTLSFVGFSLPTFWTGLLAIMVFNVWLRWLPAGGMYTLGDPFSVVDRIRHLILPLSTLALFSAGRYARYVRSSMLEVLNQDYIRTARAKGASTRQVLTRHAIRNAAIPVVTVVGLDLPTLFTGAVITETIFSWPGIGRLFWESSTRMDYPVLMAIVTVTAVLVIVANLTVDLMYGLLDPRIRHYRQ